MSIFESISSSTEGNKKAFNQAETKLVLLYLIDKMEIPLSNSQISQFTLQEELMDFFTLQEAIIEMEELGYLGKTDENSGTRYVLTDEGLTTLEYFEKHINPIARNKINKIVAENRGSVKKEYEVSANYFYEHRTNDFLVKCVLIEDEAMLMELKVSVVTKELAKQICNNWNLNVNEIYGNIISEIVKIDHVQIDELIDDPKDRQDSKQ